MAQPLPPSHPVYKALQGIPHPTTCKSFVAMGWVRHAYEGNKKTIIIPLDLPASEVGQRDFFQKYILQAFAPFKKDIKENICIVFTAHSPQPSAGLASSFSSQNSPAPSKTSSGTPSVNTPSKALSPEPLPGVGVVFGVAAAKGGVGKSTTALNVALALHKEGLRVGILDADLYGPSLPLLLGMQNKKPVSHDGKMMEPLEKHGLSCMSMGFLIKENKAAIWRGPMTHHALRQLLFQVRWQNLDVLVVDLPPGTGDIPLSLVQCTPLSGVVLVSTPQEMALIDVRRSLEMFKKMHVPIWGMVENMSGFECPSCHHQWGIFHEKTIEKECAKHTIPFLGSVPLLPGIRLSCDKGMPFFCYAPPAESAPYGQIARAIMANIKGSM